MKVLYYAGIVITILCCCCKSMWGDHSLGNNLSLLEGDREEDQIIVYCLGNCQGSCVSGINVIPRHERHMQNGDYAEYVKAAKSNKDWVIAKSFQIKDAQENFWIINKRFSLNSDDCDKIRCDSVIQRHVVGPLNLAEFEKKKVALKIDLNF